MRPRICSKHAAQNARPALLKPRDSVSPGPTSTCSSARAWEPACGGVQAGEHPWNAATGTVNKVGVGIKATGQYIKGNFIKKDLVKVRRCCWCCWRTMLCTNWVV